MDLAQQIGLSVVESRDADGIPMIEEGESILNTFSDVQLVIGSDANQGIGRLFITESKIIWLSIEDVKKGFATDFTSISMHAIANDAGEGDAKPYLYVQLANDDDCNEENEDEILPELQFIPVDTQQLESIFQEFCEGAVRNPDHDAEEEGQGNLFFDEDEALAGATEAVLGTEDEYEELVGDDPSRFDDPEDDNNPANGTA